MILRAWNFNKLQAGSNAVEKHNAPRHHSYYRMRFKTRDMASQLKESTSMMEKQTTEKQYLAPHKFHACQK